YMFIVYSIVVVYALCCFWLFFFSSRRRHTRSKRDWSSDVCSSDLITKSFQVTGFVQSVNLQGELCELSIEGYNSLFNQNQTPYLYVYLENAENAEKITKEYKSDYSALVADTVNSYKLDRKSTRLNSS